MALMLRSSPPIPNSDGSIVRMLRSSPPIAIIVGPLYHGYEGMIPHQQPSPLFVVRVNEYLYGPFTGLCCGDWKLGITALPEYDGPK
jgi:hypothetical protein